MGNTFEDTKIHGMLAVIDRRSASGVWSVQSFAGTFGHVIHVWDNRPTVQGQPVPRVVFKLNVPERARVLMSHDVRHADEMHGGAYSRLPEYVKAEIQRQWQECKYLQHAARAA
jgi:hypothetical protein